MRDYTRIRLDYDEVKTAIYECKNYSELTARFNCSADFIRHYLLEHDLYEEYCKVHKQPIKCQKKKCSICGSIHQTQTYKGVAYCKKHYNQIYRYGKIQKTIYDDNDYIVEGNITKIILRDAKQNEKAVSIIDTEDFEKIKDYKWFSSYGYCVTKSIVPPNNIDISNVIFDDFNSKFDHINHDRMDNRKINLRPVTSHQNAMNMGKKYNNKSGVTGVRGQEERGVKTGRWTATIMYDYKSIWLGVYTTFDEAVIARLKGEAKYFGEYAPTYNSEIRLLDLTYTSKTDHLIHHIQMNLNGTIVLNEKRRSDPDVLPHQTQSRS